MINIGTETAPKMIPVRHVQPVAQGSGNIRTDQMTQGKGQAAKRERLGAAVAALAEHLETQGEMFWWPPFKQQKNP